MSEINIFNDPTKVPRPRNEIRIENLKAVPYADRFRILTEISVTPFLERPNLILVLHKTDGTFINELNVIATMHYDMEFTIHIRNVDDPAGDYVLDAELFYDSRNPPQHESRIEFSIPEAGE